MSELQGPNVTDKIIQQTPPAQNNVVMPSYADLLLKEAQRLADPHYQNPTPGFVPANDPNLVAQQAVPPQQAVQHQPQTPQHSASSVYPNPGYVPEAIVDQQVVANTDADGVTAITLKIDGESMKILMNANEIFRETIVNMGIKLASQTPVYRDFFKLENLRVTSGSVGGVSGVSVGASGVTGATTDTIPGVTIGEAVGSVCSTSGSTEADSKVQTLKKKSPGFGSWA